MDMDSYLTTNILDTFTEILGIRNNHMDVVVVVVSVVGVGFTTPGTEVSLCLAVFMAIPGLSLLSDHMGYLHLDRAFLIWSSS